MRVAGIARRTGRQQKVGWWPRLRQHALIASNHLSCSVPGEKLAMPIGKDVALAINDEVRIQRGRGQDHCAQASDTGGIEYHCTTRRAIKGQRGSASLREVPQSPDAEGSAPQESSTQKILAAAP